jgi:hypothetical protein
VLLLSLNFQLQILHGELEASLQFAQEELITVYSKLEKQQLLNEKLEIDLLEIEKHQQAQINGKHEARDALKNPVSSDALAGIELGKKPGVCVSWLKLTSEKDPNRSFSDVTSTNHPDTIHVKLC